MQSHFHAVGTLQEADGLLKDLIRSALNLVIHTKQVQFSHTYEAGSFS